MRSPPTRQVEEPIMDGGCHCHSRNRPPPPASHKGTSPPTHHQGRRRGFWASYYLGVGVALSLAWLVEQGQAANPKQAHRHTGVLKPYKLEPPNIPLDASARQKLAQGKPVKFQVREGSTGGRGIVVQDVHAPPDIVMGKILDLNNYNKMVPTVKTCQIYSNQKVGRDLVDTRATYVVGMMGIYMEYYVKHLYKPSIRTVTWTLDYDRSSDFDDSVGYWSLVPRPADPKKGEEDDWTRVYYSVELLLPDWVPAMVIHLFTTQALTTATAWVKFESEKVWSRQAKAKQKSQQKSGKTAVTASQQKALPAPVKKSLFDLFVEEFADMVDMPKYEVQKKKREERRVLKKQKQQQQAKKKPAMIAPPPGWDDSHMIFMTLCLAALIFSLIYQPPPKPLDDFASLGSSRQGGLMTPMGDITTPILSTGRDEEDDVVMDDEVVINGTRVKGEMIR